MAAIRRAGDDLEPLLAPVTGSIPCSSLRWLKPPPLPPFSKPHLPPLVRIVWIFFFRKDEWFVFENDPVAFLYVD